MRYVVLTELSELTLSSEVVEAGRRTGRVKDDPFDILDFVLWIANTCFNRDFKSAKVSERITEAVEKVRPEGTRERTSDVLPLEETDWESLREFAETPTGGYPLAPARKLLPYVRRIAEAEKLPPKKAPVVEEAVEETK